MEDCLSLNSIHIDGSIKIEKFNENDDRVFVEEGKNVVKQWVYDLLKQKMASCVTAWNPAQPRLECWDSFDTNDLFRYVYLLDSSTTGMTGVTPGLNTEPCFPLKSGNYTGYLDRYNQTVGSDTKIGIIKYNESYCTPTSAVFVYEWAPSKGNGSFDTIVHASAPSALINSTSDQEYKAVRHAVTIPNGPNNAVWKDNRPTVFCMYKNVSNQLIMCHTPVLSGVDLQYTETNLAIGSSSAITIDTWNNAYNGVLPNSMAIKYDAISGDKVVLFSKTDASIKICTYSGGVWGSVKTIALRTDYGYNIDGDYIYVKQYNNTILSRYSLSGTPAGTVIVSNMHCFVYENKAYNSQTSEYYDLSSALWTGDTMTLLYNKFGTPDIAANGNKILDGEYYVFDLFSAYVTGENNGNQSGTYALVKYPLNQYRRLESAHYKGSLINKDTTETLKITYTFNFA